MLAFPIGDHRILRRHLGLLVAVLVLALTPALCAQETDSPTDKAFADARKRYDDGRFADALTVIQRYESENKFSTTLAKAIYFEACCHFGLHKYQEAADTFGRLTRTYPTSPLILQAILKEAECRRDAKSYPRAVVLYRQFETQYPNHEMLPQAMFGEAQILFEQNDLNAASTIAETIRARFPNDATVCLGSQFLLGQILMAKKTTMLRTRFTSKSPQTTTRLPPPPCFFRQKHASLPASFRTPATSSRFSCGGTRKATWCPAHCSASVAAISPSPKRRQPPRQRRCTLQMRLRTTN